MKILKKTRCAQKNAMTEITCPHSHCSLDRKRCLCDANQTLIRYKLLYVHKKETCNCQDDQKVVCSSGTWKLESLLSGTRE